MRGMSALTEAPELVADQSVAVGRADRAALLDPLRGADAVDAMTTDRRAARRAQTERALRDAALDLAEERGFDRFTVDEVASRAGVSPRTFFNYFPTKEAAVLADPEPVLAAMSDAFQTHSDRPLHESLRAAVAAFLEVSSEPERGIRREAALIESTVTLRRALLSHYCAYERLLAGLIAERMGTTVEADPLPISLASAVVAVARTTLFHWAHTAEPRPNASFAEDTFARLSSLLAT